MSGRWPFTAEKIATRLDLIEPYIFRRRQPLPHFRLRQLPAALVDAPICDDTTEWEEIPHETYWGHADLNFVLKSHFSVPQDWHADRLALHLPLGVLGDIFNHPEALVHIDTKPIGSADRYHHTIPLDADLLDGRRHVLSLHGWTGHVGWPSNPDSKAKLFMGQSALVERDPVLFSFHGLAKSTLETARVLGPEAPEYAGLIEALDQAFVTLDTRDPIGAAFFDSVDAALSVLRSGIKNAGAPLDVQLHGIGHAHMDIAYLWPISQIRLKNARTYSNVLRLMKEDPDYHFSHSQPQLYAYTAQDYPELFEEIKTRVEERRWEVMGGMWVEPDLNIPGPEALVRQLMLGRTYFRDTFGDVETPALWLPDTFGFPGQIPQLMYHAGLKWFATNKLNWNQKNKVPSTTHHWEGIDGSRVLAHIFTTPRDVQYLPFPTNYKSDLSAAEVLGTWRCSSAQEHIRDLPICYGYGDGGGGPTDELLAKGHAYEAMPGMPQFRMSTVCEVFSNIEQHAGGLPTWKGEHYMEGHRGVFTSQGWIKRANRKAEWALHEAEALAVMSGQQPDLDEAWKLLCLNQFHDVITGTSVPQVFDDARRDFTRIMEIGEHAAQDAAFALACGQDCVANTSPITGPRIAFLPGIEIADGQRVDGGSLAYFDRLPSYSLAPVNSATLPEIGCTCFRKGDSITMENATVRVVIDAQGQVTECYDKVANCSALATGHSGNVFQVFEDRPVCWDAWDIDPFIEDRQEIIDTPCSLEIVENGPLRASLSVKRTWRNSTITQIIRLAAHANRLDFETDVDWNETHTLLKVAFPTSIEARKAQFDIQWGTIQRSTARDSDFDAARFEVPAQKWAQLSTPDFAVALLNDCKYGYDVHADTIRLTLIKSATYPDPGADQGAHKFTYSLLCIPGAAREILDQQAYDLNAPLRIIKGVGETSAFSEPFIECSSSNIIVETMKPAADGKGIVVRVFEATGQPSKASLKLAEQLASVERVNFLEDPLGAVPFDNQNIALELRPFEIVSLRLIFS